MYATKRLRGLLALWLALILVFGLGTTVYAEAYTIDASGNSTIPNGTLLKPGDTIGKVADFGSGGITVHYQDINFWDSNGSTTEATKDGQNSGVFFYDTYVIDSHGNSNGYYWKIADEGYNYNNFPVWVLRLSTAPFAPGGGDPDPEPDPAPPPSPEPAPAPIRCDLPVLFDPVGPVEKYGGAGGSVTMSVSARDALRFQWQVNYNDGTGWHNVEGAVTDTYTLENLDAIHEGWQFRCVVRNNCGPVISPNFTVHVHVPVAEVPETGGPGAALAALALGLASLGAGLGIARKRRG